MTTKQIDNRGLQPPEPMVRILGALAALGPDEKLLALMDREPFLLFPELERRGFTWTFEPDGETPYRLTIWRAGE